MKRFLRFCPLVALLLTLSGCFQVSTVVRVNPDGSGTVEERLLISKKLLAQLNSFVQGFAADGAEPPKPLDLFEPDKLREAAREMGEGVSYRSGKKLATADFEGYQAEYAFTDINQLRLNQKSSAPLPATQGGEGAAAPLTFSFTKGNPATLTIRQAASPAAATADKESSPPPAPATDGDAAGDPQLRALEEMLRGLRVAVAVEVNGPIASTNATHRDGSRLTIIELDWDKLAGSKEQLARLGSTGAGAMTLDRAKELFRDVPGVKMDLNEELTVVFGKK